MKNKIKQQRLMHAFTQQHLAEQIGVSRQTIHAMEQGSYAPSTVLALKLAKVFSCRVEDLFLLEEED